MKCLNCGCTSENYLCAACTNEAVLDKIFKEIRFYKPDTCENPYLLEFASGLTEKYAEREIIPDILKLFRPEISEFYACQYYRMRRDDRFENAAVTYLNEHDLTEIRTQNVLYDLIDSYIPNDFIKPKQWCELVAETDDLCCELYAVAAKYFAMIGEYDLADSVTDKAVELCEDVARRKLIFYSPENMKIRLAKQKEDTKRYRTKKPYWPATEERRRAVAMFYDEKRNMFCGLLVCADCGHNLNFHFNQGNHDIKYFNCSNYNSSRVTCTSTHYIRVNFLEQVVLGEIKRLTKYAVRYEDEFQQAIMGSTQKTVELERKLKQKELTAAQARDTELDGLFERIYEDNLSGKLSDERFARMSQRYEEEQAGLAEKIKTLRKELDKLSSEAVSTDMFLSTVRKYTRAKKLTPRMVNELIDHIEVYQAEKIDGEWVQKLTIHYNCIGALFIPDTDSLPVPDVTVNTRRGVYVAYEPAQNEQ